MRACKNHPDRPAHGNRLHCRECDIIYQRYRVRIRSGHSHEEAMEYAQRVKGVCHKCGQPARTAKAMICLDCVAADSRERSAETRRKQRERGLLSEKNCADCGVKFMAGKGVFCDKCRFGRNRGRTYAPRVKKQPEAIPKLVERAPRVKASDYRYDPLPPKPEPLPPPPPDVPIKRIPALIPDFASYRSR